MYDCNCTIWHLFFNNYMICSGVITSKFSYDLTSHYFKPDYRSNETEDANSGLSVAVGIQSSCTSNGVLSDMDHVIHANVYE